MKTLSREATAVMQLARKAQTKSPPQFDEIMKTIFSNTVSKSDYYSFIEKALKREIDGKYVTAVGFIDSLLCTALDKENAGIGENTNILLAAKLLTQKKFSGRHTKTGNAPDNGDWYNLLDYLIDAAVYFEDGKNALIYLKNFLIPAT